MDQAFHRFRIYHTLRAARTQNPTQSRWFDVVFTPESLQHRLEEQRNCFIEDPFGGLRCRTCTLPAIYHTLHLSVFVNGRPIAATTTRFLPLCVMCHQFEGEVARLCLTTEEAIARGLVHPPSSAETSGNLRTFTAVHCGGLTDQEA